MNKTDLIQKLKQLQGLTSDEKAELINLINTNKKYGLVWEDKPEDVEEQLRKYLPVLKEVKKREILAINQPATKNKVANELFPVQEVETEIKPFTPNHILIEGDNLPTLTALTFTHEGKIDVIYIDPPYNTGNKDFKYNDSFVDKEDTFRHSKWLSFMNKRLIIAKKLLNDNGVIFISIDDNEQAQLKMLCDEIFGEMNLISDVIWQSRKSVSNDTFISLNHNYTLIYAKDISKQNKNDFRLTTSSEKFENMDNDPRGPWVADPFDAPNLRPNLTYAIINPKNEKEFWPPSGRCWRTTKEEYKKYFDDNRIVFGKNGNTKPQLKRFLDFALNKGATPISIWNDIETTTNGTQQLEEILGSKLFTNPKPIGLLNRVLKLATNNEKHFTILDFFAGSGTTLHATMQLNAKDGGNRQCILITNNENNICEEVTYERNKRVIQGYINTKGEAVAGLQNNNLRYYKSGFVPSNKSEVNKRLLTEASSELLQIKENCYTDITQENGFSIKLCGIFIDESDKCMIVVYHSRKQLEVVEALITFIKSLTTKQKIKLYAFSPEKEILAEDFDEVADKIEALPLPEAIYNAYRKTFRLLKLDRKIINNTKEVAANTITDLFTTTTEN